LAKRPITAEDLLKITFLGDPQISPDGSQISYNRKTIDTEKNKYITHIWVANGTTGKCRQYTAGQDSEAGGRWSPDGAYLAFAAGREKPKSQIYLMPTAGGEAVKLTDLPQGDIGEIKWSPDAKSIAFLFRPTADERTEKVGKEREEKGLSSPPRIITDVWYRLDGDGYFIDQHFQLHIVNVDTAEIKQLSRERYGVEDFDWSPDSKRVCFTINRTEEPSLTPFDQEILILDVGSGEERIVGNVPKGYKGGVVWSPDGAKIALALNPHVGDWWGAYNSRLYVTNADGSGSKDLFGDTNDYCLSTSTIGDTRESGGGGIHWSPDSKTLFFGIGQHGNKHVCSIPSEGGDITWLTSGEGQFELCNLDRSGRSIALAISTPVAPAEIAIGTLSGTALEIRQLTHENHSLLDEIEVVRPEEFWVTTSQGNRVHGWVVKPVGFSEGAKYPLVLEIHGGPHTQYGNMFFHEFQYLAANGYVVVFSNPRGSKGYGEAHCASIAGDWGNTDYIDVMAVADYAEQLPYVDSTRMGVTGGSYGGYMTNWIVGHSDRFKAAITDRSVVSLLSMAGTCDFAFPPDGEWKGNPWDEIDELWRQSPLKYVKNCKTPTMIVHSEGDLRCPIEQADQLYSAFKRLGVKTKYVRYPSSTSHGLSRMGPPDLRIHRLNQNLGWWEENLK